MREETVRSFALFNRPRLERSAPVSPIIPALLSLSSPLNLQRVRVRFTILSASFLGGPLAALSRDVAYTRVAARSPINFSARHRRSFDRSIKEAPSNLLLCEKKKE